MQSNIHFFKCLLRIIILLILFYYIFQLNYYRHWTSIEDQDFTLIHNSLLLNSDIRAEYHDHPGHTQILLMSLWLNFLKLLNLIDVSSYNDLNFYNNDKDKFISLIKHSRFINYFFSIFFAYTFYNIFKIITKNKSISYFYTILLITSYPVIISIGHLRTELLSAIFIFLSLLYFIKIAHKNNSLRKHVFLIGFFFVLSIFSKFQSIFIFLFFPLLTSLIEKKNNKITLNNFELKNAHKILSLILIFGTFLIWKKYVQGLNYLILPFFLIYFFFLINYLNNKFFESKQFKFIFTFYFFLGCCISLILIFLPKPFHTNNISIVVNFIGASSMFIQSSNPYNFTFLEFFNLFNLAFHKYLFYLKEIFFKSSYNEFFLLFINTILLLFLKNRKKIINYSIIILYLLTIIFIFSVRPQLNYMIYFTPIIYIYFAFIIKEIQTYKITILFTIFLISVNFYNNLNFINNRKFITDESRICSQNFLNTNSFFYDRMRLELLPNACSK